MSKYSTTTAFKKISKLTQPVRIIQGGKGSSKTISILQLFIFYALSNRKDLIMSVIGRTVPDLNSGAERDFNKLLKDYNLYNQIKINATERVYTFNNGNIIEFFSADKVESRLGSRRTHLYVNEADSMKLDTFIELQGRTSQFSIIDFNPRKEFWAHTEYKGQPDVDFIIVNYLDNEYIPTGEYKQLMWIKGKAFKVTNIKDYDRPSNVKSEYWRNMWRVLGLGQLGSVQGVIFNNWTTSKTVPEDAKYLGAGMDFGFTNSKTGLVKIYYYDQKYYLEQVVYSSGLLNKALYDMIKHDKQLLRGAIYADSAEPRTIADLRTYGLTVIGVGQKHVKSRINKMQELEFVLVGEDLENEFKNYRWAVDRRTNKYLNEPVKEDDHLIDAAFYALDKMVSRSTGFNFNL